MSVIGLSGLRAEPLASGGRDWEERRRGAAVQKTVTDGT